MPLSRRPRRALLAALAVAAASVVAACSPPVSVDPAPYAAEPLCANIMLGIPEEIGGLELRATSSQATAAYGDDPVIVVRCGVEEPGPSEERCISVESGGAAQDWLVFEEADVWRGVSFGRAPALEVLIPKARADQAVGEILGLFNTSAVLADGNGLACQ